MLTGARQKITSGTADVFRDDLEIILELVDGSIDVNGRDACAYSIKRTQNIL
ncbi:hypothetical protein [Erythrobacter sp. KY5]|uniref:hypothetical protein n=1 Tax=Erythrobacter sp. KY5 TaxID=2011159 RepID=UPI0013A6CFF2|nr:hypothetical protein [Erythrobacter sp. KY5]